MKFTIAITTLATILSSSIATPLVAPWPAVPAPHPAYAAPVAPAPLPPIIGTHVPLSPHVLPIPSRPVGVPGGPGGGFPAGPGNGNGGGAGNGNGNSGGGSGSGSNSGDGICGLAPSQVAALTPLLKKLGLADTGNEIKKLVDNIVFGVGDILESDSITNLLKTVDNIVDSLGLGGLDAKPAVDEVVSVLRNQLPCVLNTLIPLP
ncbi:hypothetical protein COEREDRAFT_7596 [Coemansia reversa NRRL 1564]|uniref:Uncharacterized protein n=1 Tax=Coemansia reversa (strain ATCC 12441 / NRRL 1564) TaxID=763665 RepID=A0A2G5BEU9_COERN|nr:hypothetical protein COEREDRAFT_7596 [Coemansia reversa NRRL 1564]|eukprot:PIA17237.1 hypothetical protein COEREDRAFT_7596 [Coemansia reversa NRRL 1564]